MRREVGFLLSFAGTVPTGGSWPRHCTLSPDQRWVYVSNQRSNAVHWLPRDPDSGRIGAPAGALPVNNVGIVLFR
jgi:6-phosphogluconolactonase